MRTFVLNATLSLIAISAANAGLLTLPYVESAGMVQGQAEDYHAKAISTVVPARKAEGAGGLRQLVRLSLRPARLAGTAE